MGREITPLVDQYMNVGTHEVLFDARSLPAGIYTYRLIAGDTSKAGLMTILR